MQEKQIDLKFSATNEFMVNVMPELTHYDYINLTIENGAEFESDEFKALLHTLGQRDLLRLNRLVLMLIMGKELVQYFAGYGVVQPHGLDAFMQVDYRVLWLDKSKGESIEKDWAVYKLSRDNIKQNINKRLEPHYKELQSKATERFKDELKGNKNDEKWELPSVEDLPGIFAPKPCDVGRRWYTPCYSSEEDFDLVSSPLLKTSVNGDELTDLHKAYTDKLWPWRIALLDDENFFYCKLKIESYQGVDRIKRDCLIRFLLVTVSRGFHLIDVINAFEIFWKHYSKLCEQHNIQNINRITNLIALGYSDHSQPSECMERLLTILLNAAQGGKLDEQLNAEGLTLEYNGAYYDSRFEGAVVVNGETVKDKLKLACINGNVEAVKHLIYERGIEPKDGDLVWAVHANLVRFDELTAVDSVDTLVKKYWLLRQIKLVGDVLMFEKVMAYHIVISGAIPSMNKFITTMSYINVMNVFIDRKIEFCRRAEYSEEIVNSMLKFSDPGHYVGFALRTNNLQIITFALEKWELSKANFSQCAKLRGPHALGLTFSCLTKYLHQEEARTSAVDPALPLNVLIQMAEEPKSRWKLMWELIDKCKAEGLIEAKTNKPGIECDTAAYLFWVHLPLTSNVELWEAVESFFEKRTDITERNNFINLMLYQGITNALKHGGGSHPELFKIFLGYDEVDLNDIYYYSGKCREEEITNSPDFYNYLFKEHHSSDNIVIANTISLLVEHGLDINKLGDYIRSDFKELVPSLKAPAPQEKLIEYVAVKKREAKAKKTLEEDKNSYKFRYAIGMVIFLATTCLCYRTRMQGPSPSDATLSLYFIYGAGAIPCFFVTGVHLYYLAEPLNPGPFTIATSLLFSLFLAFKVWPELKMFDFMIGYAGQYSCELLTYNVQMYFAKERLREEERNIETTVEEVVER